MFGALGTDQVGADGWSSLAMRLLQKSLLRGSCLSLLYADPSLAASHLVQHSL